jgi:biotin operon repressor
MRNHLEQFRQAVRKAIAANHALGLPVYQSKNGYIVAIYPDGREVKLQKSRPSLKL